MVEDHAERIEGLTEELRQERARRRRLERDLDDLIRYINRRAAWSGAPHHAPSAPEPSRRMPAVIDELSSSLTSPEPAARF